MADNDVIELGDDGTFDIVLVKPLKIADTHITEPPVSLLDAARYENECLELRKDVSAGEFKIVATTMQVCVIFRLPLGESPENISIIDNNLSIATSASKSFKISMNSVSVTENSGHSRVWEDYVFTYFTKA